MTKSDEPGPPASLPGSSVPPPPPPLSAEQERISKSIYSPVKQLWDIVTVYGPATREELHQHRTTSSGHYREYLRFHPWVKGDTSSSMMLTAERWAFDRAMNHSLDRKWLSKDGNGLIRSAQPPPGHVPLSTIGGASKLLTHLTSADSKQALIHLTAKSNPARRKPDRGGKARLERSIRDRGQLQKILKWNPHPMTTVDDVIVDGVVRIEVLTKLGVPQDLWKTEPLPPETPAVEVLLMRIELDLAATTKDSGPEGRDNYLAQLAAAGIDHAALTRTFDATKAKVARIKSDIAAYADAGLAAPSKEDVAEFVALRDAGWSARDIEDRTQWSKLTIERNLTLWDAEAEGRDLRPTLRVGSSRAKMLSALVIASRSGAHALSLPQIRTQAGYPEGSRQSPDQRQMLEEWEAMGLVTKAGGTGGNRDPYTYRPTIRGNEEFDRLRLAGEPEPVPAAAEPILQLKAEIDERLTKLGRSWDELITLLRETDDVDGVPVDS